MMSAPSRQRQRRRDEQAHEAIRDQLWAVLGRLDDPAVHPPILATTQLGRAALRRLIAPEFPDQPVLARAEVDAAMQVRTMATVSLP
jgi:flagellar biosynthesis component FlhA